MQEEYNKIDPDEIDISHLSHLDKIKYAAEKFGVLIQDPKPNCKHCHGRGYTGMKWNPVQKKNTEPVACSCIYPKMTVAEKDNFERRPFVPKNRKERRLLIKHISKKSK